MNDEDAMCELINGRKIRNKGRDTGFYKLNEQGNIVDEDGERKPLLSRGLDSEWEVYLSKQDNLKGLALEIIASKDIMRDVAVNKLIELIMDEDK